MKYPTHQNKPRPYLYFVELPEGGVFHWLYGGMDWLDQKTINSKNIEFDWDEGLDAVKPLAHWILPFME